MIKKIEDIKSKKFNLSNNEKHQLSVIINLYEETLSKPAPSEWKILQKSTLKKELITYYESQAENLITQLAFVLKKEKYCGDFFNDNDMKKRAEKCVENNQKYNKLNLILDTNVRFNNSCTIP